MASYLPRHMNYHTINSSLHRISILRKKYLKTRRDLDYKSFLILASQQGFNTDDDHMKNLYIEVQAMYRRMQEIDHVLLPRTKDYPDMKENS